MKNFLAIVLLYCSMMGAALAQKQPTGVTYDATIIRVSDGDTIVIAAPYLPKPLKPELAVRIYGVDTPEKGHRAQCPSEAQRGEQASQWTKQLVASRQRFQVTLYSWDKFGGRVLGDILVDGVSVRHGLIAAGLAREYYGDKERWSSDYVQHRLGMAVASTDGITPPNIDAKSWVGKNKTTHPYTAEEEAMLKLAYKAVGAKYQDLNNGDMESEEPPGGNVTSPIQPFRGYSR